MEQMTKHLRQPPIGIQSFRAMRDRSYSYIYVDKSRFIWQLQKRNCVYFLSRPRRFGKSLFLSMLGSYFRGEKELFSDLEIEKIKEENDNKWEVYPVLYLDLNASTYKEKKDLLEKLNIHFKMWKEEFNIEKCNYDDPANIFAHTIREVQKRTGKQVVVLVDEYDQPLLSSINNEDVNSHYREILKGFYSVLKSSNEYIRFAFITGITKFSYVTMFSGLNNLYDISLLDEYSDICGITEKEMIVAFSDNIKELAITQNTSYENMIILLKKHYDGYHFSANSEGIYNPFSLCNALSNKVIEDYWFRTGTPTFLVEFMSKNNFDIPILDAGDMISSSQEMQDYRVNDTNIVPLLFQSGYLTIRGYDPSFRAYVLGFPNDEVRYAFLTCLIKKYTDNADIKNTNFSIYNFIKKLQKGCLKDVLETIKALIASLPYDSLGKENMKLREYNTQMIIYLIFKLMGQFVRSEVHSSRGRSDIEVETSDAIYIFEFKMRASAEDALQQIETQGYHEKHMASNKKIFLIGVAIQKNGETLKEWKIKELV